MSNKVSVATVWLDGCSGCHMSFLDIDELLLELADKIDLVYSPLVDAKDFPEMVDLTLVEGAVSSVEDRAKIRKIRKHTKLLLSLGDCAITGNVPAMRNQFAVAAVQARAYEENADLNQDTLPHLIVPELLDKVRPVHAVVDVDVYLPGCPPSAASIAEVIQDLLDGKPLDVQPRFG